MSFNPIIGKPHEQRSVLALAPNHLGRENLRKTLASSNYKVSFISSLQEVFSSVAGFKPTIFIHDWAATEESQSRQFHFRASKCSDFIGLPRIVLINEVTPGILAFANDAMIDKVMSYGSANISLPTEVDLISTSNVTCFELKQLLFNLRRGEQGYQQEEVDQRIIEAYNRYPHDSKVRIEYGNFKLRKNDYQAAEIIAREILRKEPRNLRAMNLLSRVFMKRGQWDEAQSILQEAHDLSPYNPDRLILLGDVYFGKGDFDRSLEFYEQAKSLDPSLNDSANRGIGRIRLAQGHLEDALTLISNSVSEEEAAGYFNNSAVYSVKQGDLDHALKLYETALKALRTDRLKPTIYNNIALTYRRMGRADDAERYLKKSLHIDRNNPKTLKQMESLRKGKPIYRKI